MHRDTSLFGCPKSFGYGMSAFLYPLIFKAIPRGKKAKEVGSQKHSLIFILSAEERQFLTFSYYLVDLPHELPPTTMFVCLFFTFKSLIWTMSLSNFV